MHCSYVSIEQGDHALITTATHLRFPLSSLLLNLFALVHMVRIRRPLAFLSCLEYVCVRILEYCG